MGSTIRFKCHACDRKIKAPAKLSGQTAHCPSCGRVVEVPLPTVYVDTTPKMPAAPPQPQPAADRRSSDPQNRGRRTFWGILAVAPIIAAALLIAFTIDPQSKSGERDAAHQQEDEIADVVEPEPRIEQVGQDFKKARNDNRQGTGISRIAVMNKLSNEFGCEFREEISGKGDTIFKTTIAGVVVMLWGPAADLDSIQIIGAFEGEYGTVTGMVLREVLEVATPHWPVKERAEWFGKSSRISDNDMAVSTLQNGISVNVVSANIEGNVIRIVSFTRED